MWSTTQSQLPPLLCELGLSCFLNYLELRSYTDCLILMEMCLHLKYIKTPCASKKKKKELCTSGWLSSGSSKRDLGRVQSDGPSPCSSAHTVPALTVLISITVQTLKIQSTGMYQSIEQVTYLSVSSYLRMLPGLKKKKNPAASQWYKVSVIFPKW